MEGLASMARGVRKKMAGKKERKKDREKDRGTRSKIEMVALLSTKAQCVKEKQGVGEWWLGWFWDQCSAVYWRGESDGGDGGEWPSLLAINMFLYIRSIRWVTFHASYHSASSSTRGSSTISSNEASREVSSPSKLGVLYQGPTHAEFFSTYFISVAQLNCLSFFFHQPQSKDGVNSFGGLGATLIDSLDTLFIMGLDEQFQKAKKWVATSLDFNKNYDASVFETTIRLHCKTLLELEEDLQGVEREFGVAESRYRRRMREEARGAREIREISTKP
ncbi:hypothetical protein Scep_014380 [Stephania cephalantha]|uniref:alpha-1,2-Mannosidase n=1 Tax=Stephania cephalantha TaxID=152367 RepID=A0AAP0J158_9MAGN